MIVKEFPTETMASPHLFGAYPLYRQDMDVLDLMKAEFPRRQGGLTCHPMFFLTIKMVMSEAKNMDLICMLYCN